VSTTSAPIVVGIDGTHASEHALRSAMDEAVVRGCPLNVVNARDHEELAETTS
jgi:nucleotide-binding universal stress UspA family protein